MSHLQTGYKDLLGKFLLNFSFIGPTKASSIENNVTLLRQLETLLDYFTYVSRTLR